MSQLEIDSEKPKEHLTTRQAVKIAVICLFLGLVVFAVALTGNSGKYGLGFFNQPLLTWFVDHRNQLITNVAMFVTTIASPLIFASIVIAVSAVWAFTKKELWRPFLLISSVGFAAITSTILKLITMDLRPPQMYMIPTFETDFSFPSGHTIGMIVFMLVFGYVIYSRNYSNGRFWGWITAALAGTSIIAVSRLYLGYHWLTDVVASVGLGFIILAAVIFIDRIYLRKTRKL